MASRVRSNRVCLTYNNYDEYNVEQLEEVLEKMESDGRLNYAILGREIGESGTPHIQGYVHLSARHYKAISCGIKFWKTLLPGGQAMHFENARGTDEDNTRYCSKDGPYRTFGIEGQGGTRFTEIIKLAKRGEWETLENEFAEEYCRNYFQLKRMRLEVENDETLDDKLTQLRPWQESVLDKLRRQDARKILFVVDVKGGQGKSVLTQHLLSTENTWACQGGKTADLMNSYKKGAEFAIFDMARCNKPDWYPWNFMENLKSGWFTATKYEGGFKKFRKPKIVVFMNQDPPRDKLSEDRYEVYFI